MCVFLNSYISINKWRKRLSPEGSRFLLQTEDLIQRIWIGWFHLCCKQRGKEDPLQVGWHAWAVRHTEQGWQASSVTPRQWEVPARFLPLMPKDRSVRPWPTPLLHHPPLERGEKMQVSTRWALPFCGESRHHPPPTPPTDITVCILIVIPTYLHLLSLNDPDVAQRPTSTLTSFLFSNDL